MIGITLRERAENPHSSVHLRDGEFERGSNALNAIRVWLSGI
jgi:hypothetical protein